MGNDASKKNEIESTIKICLDKQMYYPEETCTGRIIFDVAFPVLLNDIQLDLNANESWVYVKSKYDEDHLSEKWNATILSYILNIRQFLMTNALEINLPPGQYTLPFSFIIPKHITASFKHPGPPYFSSIEYTLVVKVISNYVNYSSNINIKIPSLPFILNQPLKHSTCVNTHSWLFFDQGSVILNAQYPTNNYRMLDTVPLTIFVDNTRGKIKTHSIKIELKRKLTYSGKDHKRSYQFDFSIHKEIVPFVIKPNNKETIDIKFQIIDNSEYKAKVNTDNNEIMFLMPSVNGYIVKCEYYIKVKLYFQKFVTSSYLPKVYMPVVISHKTMDECYLQKKGNDELEQAILLSQMEAEQNKYNQINNNNLAPQPANMMLNQNAPIYNHQQNTNNFEPMQTQPFTPTTTFDMNSNHNNNNMNFNSQGTNYYQNTNQTMQPLNQNIHPPSELNNQVNYNYNNNGNVNNNNNQELFTDTDDF